MRDLSSLIAELLGFEPELTHNLFVSFLTIVSLLLIRAAILRIVFRQTADVHSYYRWKKNITYLAAFIGVFIVGRIWVEGCRF